MALTQDELIQKVVNVLPPNNHVHKHYARTVNLAKFYNQIVTGVDQAELIVSLRERETKAQKEQRVKITHKRTKSASSRVLAVFDKPNKVELLQDKIEFQDGSEKKLTTLSGLISTFHANAPLQKYLNDRFKFYNAIDPNAWLVINYDAETAFDGRILDTPRSYPTEIHSRNALDYEYDNGILEYLITCESETVQTSEGKQDIPTYYGFTAGLQIYAAVWNQDAAASGVYPLNSDGTLKEPDHVEKVDDKQYYIWSWQTLSKVTPAMQWGYLPDYQTNLETFVGILDNASEHFKELIDRGSQYDISAILHTFMQKLQVMEPCDHVEGKRDCRSGQLYPKSADGNDTCPSCSGSGVKVHKSGQDVISVKRVMKDEEQYIPLNEMIHYVDMPFNIVPHQRDEVSRLFKEIVTDIFGVDIAKTPTVATTATEDGNRWDNVYSVLSAYCDHKSQMHMFTVRLTAQHAGVDEGLIVQHKHPKDFKLVSTAELVATLSTAKGAGASQDILGNIQNDILAKQNQDNPAMLKLHEVKEKFRPFKGLPENQVLATIMSMGDDNKFKILYLYNDMIFNALLDRKKDFLLMPFTMQKQEVEKQIKIFKEENGLMPVEPVDRSALDDIDTPEPASDE